MDAAVLDQPHRQEGKTDLVGSFWSGRHGTAVKGINPGTLFHGEGGGRRVPVNFRVVDRAGGKTKNELFRELVAQGRGGGLALAIVTAASWYSGVEHLRFLRDRGRRLMIALERNRAVGEGPGEPVRVADVDLPGIGQTMCRRHFGRVGGFRTVDEHHDARPAAAFDPRKKSAGKSPGASSIKLIKNPGPARASIAPPSRSATRKASSCAAGQASRHHLGCSGRAGVERELPRWRGENKSGYGRKPHLADAAVTNFIQQRTHASSA